jgi:hypothetical protein
MPEPDTICGYGLADVRRSLRDAIDRRERRAADRWTAELVATPGAVGSLWASYWLAWAAAQGAGSSSPTVPILLRQTWETVSTLAYNHGGDWAAFRNDPLVRGLGAEMTVRLLGQTRQTPVVWPTKEITIHDVGNMRAASPPPEADGRIVLQVWIRDEDSMELRMMAGRWMDAIQRGDLRTALSAVAWTLLSVAQQGGQQPLKCAERGPATLTPKQRASPLWFWLAVGKSLLAARTNNTGLHRGWATMHAAVAEAFRLHYKRWTATDRMRVLLAWILQIRATYEVQQGDALWTAPPLRLTVAEIDLPYKEVAAELSDPQAQVIRREKAPSPKQLEKDDKKAAAARMEARMAEADAKILAAMGISDD